MTDRNPHPVTDTDLAARLHQRADSVRPHPPAPATIAERSRRLRRRRAKVASVSIAAASAAVLAGALAIRPSPEDQAIVDVSTPIVPPASVTASGAVDPRPANQPPDTSEQTVGAGWVRYGAAPALSSGSTPQDAWIERPTPGSRTMAALQEGAERLEVRDQPGGGSIVGYDYVGLGFVSLAEAPGFDARAARVSRYGCDFLLDPVCAATLTEQGAGAAGPVPPSQPPGG